jgi:CHAT domain-containing protein
MALPGWGGCRASPAPEALFAEAEQQRARHRKAESEQAIAKYRNALAAWRRAGDKRRAARAAQRIGATFGDLGRLRESLAGYLEALPLAQGAAARALESEVLSDLGMTQALLADRDALFDQAGERCEAALRIARQLGAVREEAKALSCSGDVAYYRQRPEEALESYERAQRSWEGLGDRQGLIQTLRLRGAVYSDLFDFARAQACYEQATALSAPLADERERAIALILDARMRDRLGEYQAALNEYADALNLLEPMGDAVWEASGLTGIATVYHEMGEPRSSVPYWERALTLFETAGLKNIAIDVLFAMGASDLAAGDDIRALGQFELALGLADELGIPRWRAYALRYIGVIYLFRHQPDQAQEYLERSLKIQESLEDRKTRGRTLADLGEAHALRGEYERAVSDFSHSLALSRVDGDRVARARALFGLARASLSLDDLETARSHAEQALAVVESLRSEVDDRDLRASYLASVYRYHEFHMDVLMRLHRMHPDQGLAAAAFAASERARARSLLDSLVEAGVDLQEGLDPGLRSREQRARKAFEQWAARERRLSGAPEAEAGATALAEAYRDLERRYNQVEAEIRSKSPNYAALARPRPLSLGEVQRQVVDGGTLLLEYALGDERSYLWAVSSAGLGSYVLPPRGEIEGAARRAYEHLTARLTATGLGRRHEIEAADGAYWQEAGRLSEMLLAPVARQMAGKRLLVVADGTLQYLPFAALPVPGRVGEPVPLMTEHEIVSLPSASVLAILRKQTKGRKPPPGSVAVLADPVFEGDDPRLRAVARAAPAGSTDRLARDASPAPATRLPRLAATRQEAAAIVALALPGTALRAVDFQASRATAMSPELAHYRIVHFATHGVVDNENPGLSAIVLSMFDERGEPEDGYLRLRDVYGLRLPAELVVLSACNTALGRPVGGEGLVGIVRGFMYAGARRVVASLWKVDDDATGEMMGRFYREVLRSDRSPAAALRQAQLAMWRQERWRPPFYWAAFVLQGEWR